MTVPALVGATAVGKTTLSIAFAQRLDGELISMDSRQVYRGMDIGTAKVDRQARSTVPHHGLDLIDPDERYSAARFARDARRWIHEIRGRGRLPILVGGTGFFLRALADPLFKEPKVDDERRERLRSWLGQQQSAELARWVRVLDPDRAPTAQAGGAHRLSRTLEVALLTGRSLSWWHREGSPDAEPLDIRTVLVELPRDDLYARIDRRTQEMFSRGLLDEVQRLLDAGYSTDSPGMTGTGYREAVSVVHGEFELREAIERAQNATRAYARRQLTWFRNQLSEPALRIDASDRLQDQVDRVAEWWARTGAGPRG